MKITMAKSFYEVFPTIRVKGELHDLFADVQVTRVAFNKDHTRLRVYLDSGHLIPKKHIYEMETLLTGEVCGETGVQAVLIEHFVLSALYNPEMLMREYKDSLVIEMWKNSPILGSFFKEASFAYPEENKVEVHLENSGFSRDGGVKIHSILEQVFRERCGMDCSVSMVYDLPVRHHARAVLDEPAPAAGTQASTQLPADKTAEKAENAEKAEDKLSPMDRLQASADRAPMRGAGKQAKKGAAENKAIRSFIRSNRPEVICGREFDDDAMPISDIIGEMGEVTIRGKIMANERRDIRNEKSILKFTLTDFTDSIIVKIFAPTMYADQTMNRLAPGNFVKVKGFTKEDTFEHEITVSSPSGIMEIPSFETKRRDNFEKKRVELHMHTKMSDMDGVSECKDLVKRAYQWGWPAVAITDHGNVQAFPDANHLVEALYGDEC